MTVMGSDTEYLPDEITYGFVADRVLLAIGDTTGDDDRFPDGVPAKGTVKFSPERTILYTQETPATVLPQDIECTIYHRHHPVVVKDQVYKPENVGKLVDPAGHVGNVALIVGWYEAVYRLETGTAQRFRFKVLPEHTADNPLWLPSVAPLTPTPSERFVVNEQVYNDTQEARDEAVDAAVTAVQALTGAETARDTAGTHATASATSASTAADILAANQALGITVDTSVGTRVYVGDTMIYGDTGWRMLSPNFLATGHILLRRVGNLVYLKVGEGSFSLLTLTTVDPSAERLIESSFRPDGQEFSSLRFNITKAEAGVLSVQSNGWVQPRMGSNYTDISDTLQSGAVIWVTDQAWPTSLPGLPA